MGRKKSFGERYFEGYIQKEELREDGKGIRKYRVYVGDIYKLDATDEKCTHKKIAFAVLGALFIATFFVAGLQRVEINTTYYVMLPYAIGLLLSGYALIGVWHQLFTKREMTVFSYNEFKKKIEKGSKAGKDATYVTLLASVIYFAIKLFGSGFEPGTAWKEVLVFLGYLVGSAAITAIHYIEKNSKYICIPGKKGIVNDGLEVEDDDLAPVVGVKALEDDEEKTE